MFLTVFVNVGLSVCPPVLSRVNIIVPGVSLSFWVHSPAQERQALRVILENKIKTMVDAITTGLSSSGGGDPQRLLREAAALQKLVNASVTAMKFVSSLLCSFLSLVFCV